jgi:hypothetical protein
MMIDDQVRHLLRDQVHAEVPMWNHVQVSICHDVNVHIEYKIHGEFLDGIWDNIWDQVWDLPQ